MPVFSHNNINRLKLPSYLFGAIRVRSVKGPSTVRLLTTIEININGSLQEFVIFYLKLFIQAVSVYLEWKNFYK